MTGDAQSLAEQCGTSVHATEALLCNLPEQKIKQGVTRMVDDDPSIEREAKTDSDLVRPPGGDHPATQQASPGILTRSAARCGRSAAKHTH
jgi:hypothetical protein